MKFSLAIFDLDGTVLDTLDDLCDSVNFALTKNNLPNRSIDEVRSFIGNGIKLLIKKAVPENISDEIVNNVFFDFNQYYKLHNSEKTKPYPGILTLLNKLRQNNIKTAVVSNKADFAVQMLVNKFFDGYFNFYVGERENVAKKPAPDSVIEVLKYFNIDKKNAVYIGDSEVDIQTAYNAGVECVCVNWGFRDEQFLIDNNAKIIVSNTNELYCTVMGVDKNEYI